MSKLTRQKSILDNPLTYLKGVGPAKADLLLQEMSLASWRDLLYQYPFRYIDKTKFHRVIDLLPDSGEVQLKGRLTRLDVKGEGRKKRLVGRLRDGSNASLELVWFTGVSYLDRMFKVGQEYVAYGRVQEFGGRLSISHPEMELQADASKEPATSFAPVYHSTEKLNRKGLDS
ncbi:MAG: OB-fold nucleic acid binding domain-containing protein, partial [Bacteroidota bacterium]